MSKKGDFVTLDGCKYLDCFKVERAVGEIWHDHAGNECFFRDNGTISCRTVISSEILTIQSEKDACDVNEIVAKFRTSGMMTNVRTDSPSYGDFSSAVDYHTAVLRAQEAQDTFMSFPASVRKRFNNDPGELIEFIGNEANREEAVKLGLIEASSPAVVPDPASPAKAGGDTAPPVVS